MSQAMEKAVQGLIYAMSGIVDIVLLGVEIATDSVLSILTLGSLNNQNTGLTGKYNEGNYELQKFRNGNQYQENLNKLGTRTGAEMQENDGVVDFMITSGLVVASFIPGAAAVTVPALIAYKAMRGAYEGGAGGAAAGAVAGAINTVTQKGGVSVNLGYSYANGYSAGVSVGFGPNGTGPQVGLDWSDKNGFGASVGYGFENGVGLDVGVSQRGGTTYSASLSGKGVPVSLNYSLNVNGGKQTNTFGVSIQLPGTEHFSNVRGSLNYSDRLGLSSGVSYNIGKGDAPKPMTEAERAQYNLLDDLIGGLGSVVSGIGRGVKSVWDGVIGGDAPLVMMPIGMARGSMAQDPIANRYGINGPEEKSILSTIVDWFSTSVLGNKPESFDAALALMRSGSADARKAAGEYLNANVGKITAAQQAELDIFYHNAGVITLTEKQYAGNMTILREDAKAQFKDQLMSQILSGESTFKMTAYEREILRTKFGGLVDNISVFNAPGWASEGRGFVPLGSESDIGDISMNVAGLTSFLLNEGSGLSSSARFNGMFLDRAERLSHEVFHLYQNQESNPVFSAMRYLSDKTMAFLSSPFDSEIRKNNTYKGALTGEARSIYSNLNLMNDPNRMIVDGQYVYREQLAQSFMKLFRSEYNKYSGGF